MRFRNFVLLTLLVVDTIMALFCFSYEKLSYERVQKDVAGYAKVFASMIRNDDHSGAEAYAHVIVDQGRYRRLTITYPDGTQFLHYESPDPTDYINRLLITLHLIRDYLIRRSIVQENHIIAHIDAVWINQNIHTYFYIGGPLATAIVLLLISMRYRSLKEEKLLDQIRFEEERNERLRSDSQLASTQAQFKDLVESANDIIYETNLHGRISYANPVAERIIGHTHEVLLSKRYSDFVRPDYRSQTQKFYRKQLSERTQNTYLEFPVLTEDGHQVWLGQNVQLVVNDDRPVGFQAVARDITSLKEAADAIAERDEKMQEEMYLAKMISQALLPIRVPQLDGFTFGLRFVPSGGIGGDFVSIVRFKDPYRIGVVFADITGHGVAAALLSAMLKVLVDDIMGSGRSPQDCFRILNQRLSEEYPEGNFASAVYAIFDSTDTSCMYAKASQEPVIIIQPGKDPIFLDKGGPALGLLNPTLFGDPMYADERIQLRPGDTVFFYTDGLTELDGNDDNIISQEELVSWLQEEAHSSPQDLVDHIFDRARERAEASTFFDDVAMLAVRVDGSA